MENKIILLIATLLAFGCTTCIDDPVVTVPDGEAMLSFETTITDDVARSVAVLGTNFSHEARMNLILTDVIVEQSNYNGATKTYVFKKPTEGAGLWIPGEDGGHQLIGAKAQVLAHYPAELPAEASLSDDKRILTINLSNTIDFGQMGDYNADNAFFMELEAGSGNSEVLLADSEVDYMIGKGADEVNNAKQSTTIPMYHALAMLVVRARKAPENTNPGALKSISFENRAPATPLRKGSHKIADGSKAFVANSSLMSYTRTMEGFPDGTCFALMVYPATFNSNEVNLKLVVDQATYTLPIKGKTWQAGRIMFYNVTLKATTAELNESGMSSLPWPDIEPDNSHEVPLD